MNTSNLSSKEKRPNEGGNGLMKESMLTADKKRASKKRELTSSVHLCLAHGCQAGNLALQESRSMDIPREFLSLFMRNSFRASTQGELLWKNLVGYESLLVRMKQCSVFASSLMLLCLYLVIDYFLSFSLESISLLARRWVKEEREVPGVICEDNPFCWCRWLLE